MARCAPVSPTFGIHCTILGTFDNQTLLAPVKVTDYRNGTTKIDTQTKALTDSGAEGEFIDQNYAKSLGTDNIQLEKPIPILNVNGTWNKQGTITHYTELNMSIGNSTWKQHFYITGLGKQKMIFGFTWLKE